MLVISDHDMGIVCDKRRCTAQAYYSIAVVEPKHQEPLAVELLCPQHTAETLQRAANLLEADEKLHDVIHVDHLVNGAHV